MNRLDRIVWLAAFASALIGLALAHAIPSCVLGVLAAPRRAIAYYVEIKPGSCVGRDLAWLKWTAGIGGFVVAAVILSVGWLRRRVAGVQAQSAPLGTNGRGVRVLIVLTVAVLIALLVPSVPLFPSRSAVYVAGVPLPMDNRIPLRLAILAAGATIALVTAMGHRAKSAD